MGAAPSSAATRPMDTAPRPSASATRTAASTIRARLRAGFGPLCGRSRIPQAAAMLSGIRALAVAPPRSALASAPPELAISLPSSAVVDNILVLRIAYAIMRMTCAETSARRTMNTKRPAWASQMSDELVIEESGLVKSYREVRVLSGVDLRVRRGSVFALLGPNGAGKPVTEL